MRYVLGEYQPSPSSPICWQLEQASLAGGRWKALELSRELPALWQQKSFSSNPISTQQSLVISVSITPFNAFLQPTSKVVPSGPADFDLSRLLQGYCSMLKQRTHDAALKCTAIISDGTIYYFVDIKRRYWLEIWYSCFGTFYGWNVQYVLVWRWHGPFWIAIDWLTWVSQLGRLTCQDLILFPYLQGECPPWNMPEH